MRADDTRTDDTRADDTRADDERLIAAEPDLPGAGAILDPAVLRERLRDGWGHDAVEDARVAYLRYKAGTSLVAGLVVTGRDGTRTRAFAAAHRPDRPQKTTKALRAGDRDDGARPVLADHAAGLAIGEASTDRRLPGIRWVLGRSGGVEPLVYKPGRRWVGLAGSADADGTLSSPSLVKVHEPSRVHEHVAKHRLLADRVPTADLLAVHPRRGVIRTAFVPGTPLDRLGPLAERVPVAEHWQGVGGLMASVHRAPAPSDAGDAVDRPGELTAALDAVAALMPELVGAARETAGRVLQALDGRRERALVHGDLSADQIIVRPDGGLTLIDLDRAGIDDPLADLAGWAAAEIVAGRSQSRDPSAILGPLLVGYGEAGGTVDRRALNALTAGALLQRATEPFRGHAPRWGARIAELVTAAHELATEAARPASRPASRSAGTALGNASGYAPAGLGGRIPTDVIDVGERWTLVRAWPRGTDHALLELTDDGARTAAGQWFADPADLAHAAGRAPGPARTVGGILLQPDGADARLRDLAGILARPGARLVAHRPGRRAVVRLDGTDRLDGTAAEYLKVVRPGRAAVVARRIGHVASLRSAVVPTVRDIDEAAGALRLSAVGERTLLDAGADPARPTEELERVWEQVGRVVTELHELDRTDLPGHAVEDEIAAVARWTRAAVHHRLLDAADVEEATRAVERELRSMPDAPLLGVLHRDLHDKQLLLREDDPSGRLGLIDVDTLAVGERALDVANLEVHLELRQRQGLLSMERAEGARAALRRTLPADERLWTRVPAYAAATRLRLAGVYAFRPRWAAVAREMLSAVTPVHA